MTIRARLKPHTRTDGGQRPMPALLKIFLAMALAALPAVAAAETFDGSEPLLCAALMSAECVPGRECREGTPQAVNVPRFIKIDFAAKTLRATRADGSKLITGIDNVIKDGAALILQGVEGQRGWTVILAKKNGQMTMTAAGDGVAFVVFGACTGLQ